jgi:hypothetical protein
MQRLWQRHKMSRTTLRAIVLSISIAGFNSAPFVGGGAEAEEIASGGSLSFFADERDVRILLDRLNSDPEIAFIVPEGPRMPRPRELMPELPSTAARHTVVMAIVPTCDSGGYWQRWHAARPVDGLNDGEHTIWHISAGPLVTGRELQTIPDPWGGWDSARPFCSPNVMSPATIRLHLETRHAAYTAEERATHHELNSFWVKGDLMAASDFQWSAASVQPGGSQQTARWVAALESWFSQNAVGLHDRGGTEVFWAFPSALQRLKSGVPYYSRSFDLDESIRNAPDPGR